MLASLKIAYKNLKRRKQRSILTIIAIALGVSIMAGVNMGNDTMTTSLNHAFNEYLGETDLVYAWYSGVSYQAVKNAFASSGVNYLGNWVPRYFSSDVNLTLGDGSGNLIEDIYGSIAGIDVTLPQENEFGSSILLGVLPAYENVTGQIGSKVDITALLRPEPSIARPVVVTKEFLQSNGLWGTISVGDKIYIQNGYFLASFPHSTSGLPTSWPDYTITGIINDEGKMATYSIGSGILYLNIDDIWNYIDNSPGNQGMITMLFVQCTAESHLTDLQYTLNALFLTLNSGFYSWTPKTDFATEINTGVIYVRLFFSVIAAIALVICGVLVKNLFETAKRLTYTRSASSRV